MRTDVQLSQAAAPCSGVSPMSSMTFTSCPRETSRRMRRHSLHHAAPWSGDSASPRAPELRSPKKLTSPTKHRRNREERLQSRKSLSGSTLESPEGERPPKERDEGHQASLKQPSEEVSKRVDTAMRWRQFKPMPEQRGFVHHRSEQAEPRSPRLAERTHRQTEQDHQHECRDTLLHCLRRKAIQEPHHRDRKLPPDAVKQHKPGQD